jgi:TIR domain/Bacterial SH3 domain
MAGKIFINYRRDDSIGMAGRLHDRLAQTFGRDKLFMDVDHIPAGADFVAHLNNQVAECDVVLAIIGPNWLRAKDKAGQRRLHQPDDFVAIEIAAALARDTLVIPVLVDAARMPKESDLPDTLKPLARRQAVEVRHAHFGHDAEALIARMRKALGQEVAGPGRWSVPLVAAVAATLLLLVGWGGYAFIQKREGVELQRVIALKAEAEAKRKADEGERQRLAALRAEQERQARAAAEADAKRKADEARQQQAAVSAEQERRAKTGPEASPTAVTKRIKRDISLGYLNLRSGPGQDQKVLVRIPAGSTGVVMRGRCVAPKDSTSAYPFCLVEWNGYEGWVSSNGLE